MKKCVVILLSFFFVINLFAEVKFNGSFENIGGLSIVDNDVDFTNIAQLRMKLQYKADGWRMYSDIKLSAYSGFSDVVDVFPDAFIFQSIPGEKSNFALGLDLSRLYIRAALGNASITLGRDYISFGTPFVFNVLEWYKNSSLLDQTALKPAINLFSCTMPIGSFGKFKAFIGGDNKWETPLVGSEIILGASGVEGGITYQYKDWYTHVLGGFLKVDIGVSLFVSYAAHIQNALIDSYKFNQYHEASFGIDYSFPFNFSSLLVSQSFYFNSNGASSKDAIRVTPIGDYFYTAMWYSYTSLGLSIDEFTSCGIDVLLNLVDFSGSVIPTFSIIILDGLDLNIGLGINFGKTGTEFFMNNVANQYVTGMINISAKF